MKKLLYLFLFLLPLTVWAQPENKEAIQMVSYEQKWSDYDGTLSLKNNTDKEICNIHFRIRYYEMNGTEMDYREFSSRECIAAGMTKKIDIEAYEHSRHYSYYNSESSPISPHKFKISFELLDYGSEGKSTQIVDGEEVNYMEGAPMRGVDNYKISDNSLTKDDISLIIFVIVIGLILLGITVGLYILVAVMAKNRNRSVIGWIILSIIVSPLIIALILLVVGKSNRPSEFD